MIVLIVALCVIEAMVLLALGCQWVNARLNESARFDDSGRGTAPNDLG